METKDNKKKWYRTNGDNVMRAYINALKAENFFDEDQHRWMRSDPFNNEIYCCDFKGDKITLERYFWNGESKNKGNIIIIGGKKHIGKSFFAEKILKECGESTVNEKKDLLFAKVGGEYRIPILIERDWFAKWREDKKYQLNELILKAIEEKTGDVNWNERKSLMRFINESLAYGRFVVYFQDNDWIKQNEDLDRILKSGKVFGEYKARTKYHNVVILTADIEGRIRDSFLNERYCGYIILEPLRSDEVKTYLQRNLPQLLEIVEKNEDIMNLLCYPEHLKMFETLCDMNLLQQDDIEVNNYEINNKFDLYNYFIRAHIRKVLESKNAYSPARENEIFKRLQEYAWKCYVNGQATWRAPTRYFSVADLETCGLLDGQSGKFEFPYCGYYLVANQLVEQIKKHNNKKLTNLLPTTVDEEELEIILLLVSKMIIEQDDFSEYWNMLVKDNRYPLLLLAKIMKESEHQSPFQHYLYEKAFDNLKSDFYDYSVLETFLELETGCVEYLKTRYTNLETYEEEQQNNIRKRIVYYLGISHNGITQQMIEDLMADETDRHLKYHIIRAAVENYHKDEKTTELIDKYIEQLSEYCRHEKDPIIESDFSLLIQMNHSKGEWLGEKDKLELMEQVKSKLNDSVYWVRAHAAGALGRKKGNETTKLLLEHIKKELANIYDMKQDFRNSIKVISYSVEALCELSAELSVEEQEEVIKEFVQMIDIPNMKTKDIEDAYSTIVTGIEYMINPDPQKLAFNLGGRFRNRTSNYKKILLYVLQELGEFNGGNEEIWDLASEKCSQLKDVKDREGKNDYKNIRVLHLSDWHYVDDNTWNNMIFRAVKAIKSIDILVITGDLKHYNGDYTESLTRLRELVAALQLSVSDVFMVPGNHDAGTIEEQVKIYAAIREKIGDNPDAYEEHKDSLYTAFDQYVEFAKEFYGYQYYKQCGVENTIFTWKDCLQLLCVNTAMVCDADGERAKIIDTKLLSKLELEKEFPVIGLSHHPFSAIHPAQKELVKGSLKDLKTSVLLSGDRHVATNETIGGVDDGIPNFVIGKLSKEAEDAFSEQNIAIYSLDLINRELVPELQKWGTSEFEPSTRFSARDKDGNFKPTRVRLL